MDIERVVALVTVLVRASGEPRHAGSGAAAPRSPSTTSKSCVPIVKVHREKLI
jgi:hypothetical protein